MPNSNPIIDIRQLNKTYNNGLKALENINLSINKGEIFALLGPNGAGKTTLISTITGIVSPSSGTIKVQGFDTVQQFRESRKLIGLVPQELTLSMFDTVWNTVRFSQGLFGGKYQSDYLEELLRSLSLWEKRAHQLRRLSGGMKRRVLIAKALSHQPKVLFLDEPSAGVDVELRKDMWAIVKSLSKAGVTIILTTHYIEEAEAMADRIGIINHGKILLVEDKNTLIQKLGKKQLTITLRKPIASLPPALIPFSIILSDDGYKLIYSYDSQTNEDAINTLLQKIAHSDVLLKDIQSTQTSLEEIFVDLVHN